MDMDSALIKEVRKHPMLYDSSHYNYKTLKEKDKVWKEIAANLKINENNCKRRWKGLRDTYNRWKKLMQVTKKIDKKNPRRRWRYSTQMMFLDDLKSMRDESDISLEDCEELNFFEDQDSTEMFLSNSPGTQEHEKSMIEECDREKNVDGFPELIAAEITAACRSSVNRRNQQDSTTLHFLSLAAKIRESNFPMSICNQIEAEVSRLVFSEIEKYQNFLCEENEYKNEV